MTQTPTLVDFGHGAMRENGRAASGTRPCLIVLVEYSDFPPFSDYHPQDYYPDLAFGTPAPPFSGVNPASLREYFWENSNRRFRFDDAGVVGPIAMGKWNADLSDKPEMRWRSVLDQVSEQIFTGLDTNHDAAISADELCVVIFENYNVPGNPAQPANRDNYTVMKVIGDPPQETALTVHIAGAGPVTPFYQIAHELSHSLGTVDLYGYGKGSYLLTLMGAYSFDSNDQVPVHLDAWHKLRLGWIEPKVRQIASAGSELLTTETNGSIILWDTDRREAEYFLFERRGPSLPGRSYDSGVGGDGVLIWRISNAGVGHLGAPSLVYGGSTVWRPGSQTPLLRWADGTSAGASVRVTSAADGALSIEWMPWGLELSQSEPQSTVIEDGGIISRTKTDQCGNVLRFGTWKTKTSSTFTVVTTGFGGPGSQIDWAVQEKPIAPGVTNIAVDAGASTFAIHCEVSADGHALTLSSSPGDIWQVTVSAQVTDPAGRSARVEDVFQVDGYYSGMYPDDIGRAARCIKDNIPVLQDPGDFIIPPEWPGWNVNQWKQRAINKLEVVPAIDNAGRAAIKSLIELQVESPQFKDTAVHLLQKR